MGGGVKREHLKIWGFGQFARKSPELKNKQSAAQEGSGRLCARMPGIIHEHDYKVARHGRWTSNFSKIMYGRHASRTTLITHLSTKLFEIL